MKNLYNQNFAGIKTRFIWLNDSAEKFQNNLTKLKDLVKQKSIKNFEDLKQDVDTAKVLNDSYTELNNLRKGLLNGDPAKNTLKETTVNDTINSIFDTETDRQELKKAVGLAQVIDNKLDADDVLDLDEMRQAQEFTVENFDLILEKTIKSLNTLPETPEKAKIKSSLESAISKIMPEMQKLGTENLTPSQKQQIESKISEITILELAKVNLDMGFMLEKFAEIAKKNPNNNSDDIDKTLAQYIRENSPKPASETTEAPANSMEEIYVQNPEIAKFLAEYYPTPSGKTLGDDLATYNITSLGDLPEFFLNAQFGTRTNSIKSEFKNYSNDEAFEKLQLKIIADEKNNAPASGLVDSVKDSFRDIWTDVKSFMPPAFEHFQWTTEDVKNASSVEELFTNKMKQVLLGSAASSDPQNPYQKPKKALTLDKLVSLSRPLDLNNPNDLGMIDRLRGDIPDGYKGSEWAEKYRGALINGETRKNFDNWLSKSSGISFPERIGNKLSHNLMFYVYQILSWFGNDSAIAALKKLKEERAKDDDPEKSPNNAKINEALKTKKAQDKIENTKNTWENASPQEIDDFVTFHKKYAKVLDIDEKNLDETKKIVNLNTFKNTWNSPKSREILDWAVVVKGKISVANWQKLAEDANNAENTYHIDSTTKTLSRTPGQLAPRSISKWSDAAIDELFQPDPRESVWEKFAEPENGEPIFDETLDAKFFMQHADVLFEDPKNPENSNLKPFWKDLFNLPAKFYKDGKLTATDFETLKTAIEASKLDNGFDEEIDPDSSWDIPFMGKDSDYWAIKNGKLEKVSDGKYDNSGESVEEIPNSFAVDLNGNNLMFDENFSSVKALVKRLEMNV